MTKEMCVKMIELLELEHEERITSGPSGTCFADELTELNKSKEILPFFFLRLKVHLQRSFVSPCVPGCTSVFSEVQ